MKLKKTKRDRPQPPDDLTPEACEEFHRAADILDDAGRLQAVDRAILTLYAQTWDIHQKAVAAIAKEGAVIDYSNGVRGPNPNWKVAQQAGGQLRRLIHDLGLSPSGKTADADEDELPV